MKELTRELIESLGPGVELDELILTHVYGGDGTLVGFCPSRVPGCGWQLRDKMLEDRNCEVIVKAYRNHRICTIYNEQWAIETTAEADTDELAICRAALLAVIDKKRYREEYPDERTESTSD